MTVGPSALGTARAFGLSGSFDGVEGEAVESMNARAYEERAAFVLNVLSS